MHTDGLPDMSKLIVAFRNSPNAPKQFVSPNYIVIFTIVLK